MSNPFGRNLSRKISGEINDRIEKSEHRDTIRSSICIGAGLVLLLAVVFRLMKLPFTTQNNIMTIIATVMGLFLLLIGIAHRNLKKKKANEEKREEK